MGFLSDWQYLVKSGFIGLCALAMVATAGADSDGDMPEVRIPVMSRAPQLDGVVGEEEWKEAARIEGFAGRERSEPMLLAPHQAGFWVGADDKNLYIAVVTATPPGEGPLARVQPAPEGKNARVNLDDAVEVMISPLEGDGIYRLLLNAKGAISATHEVSGEKTIWKSGVEVRNGREGDLWALEARIPLANLGVTRKELEKGIGLSVGRIWKRVQNTEAETRWSGLTTGEGRGLPTVTLDPAAPVVQMKKVTDEKQNVAIELELFNPHSKPVLSHLTASLKPMHSAPRAFRESIVLKPNATKTLQLRLTGAHDPAEKVNVDLKVTGNKNETLYSRQFALRNDAGDALWQLGADLKAQVDARFAYFPSYDEIKVAVRFKALRHYEKVHEVVCAVLDDKGEVLAETTLKAVDGQALLDRWKVPKLKEGEYRFRVTLMGTQGAIATTVQPFLRAVFPWEGNPMGTANVLVPPFTALKLHDNKVSALLRDHLTTPTGLWEQVEAKGRSLLAGPMELRAKKGEADIPVQKAKREVISETDTAIEIRYQFSLSELDVQVQTRWEQDGLMYWTLELPPNPSGALDELSIVIPLKEEEARLIHACTDGLRFNVAGELPKGEGVVWKSTDAPRNLMLGDFVPYIWLGGEERGVAVFGENDRGWITADGVPVQEVTRRNGRVELHCRLVSGGGRWTEPRTIRLGFQATPIKPMPPQWRTTYIGTVPDDILKKYGDRIRLIRFMGSTGTYGSAIQAAEPAPRNNDFTIWSRLAKVRKTGVADPQLIEEWKRGSTGIYGKGVSASELNYGVHLLSQKPREVLAYTNPRGVRMDTPEGQTFIDEWITGEFSNRRVGPLAMVAYTVDPVKSYQDWMLWLYSKMFEFCDHIYWDDIFLAANFDLATSDAYVRSDGKIVPSSGLFNMRELVRRTAVLGVEMGRTPFNMLHSTNTTIAPIFAFAQMHYTWEDKSGVEDFQDRWSKDYIRAESIGRQHGTVPVVLMLIRNKDLSPVSEDVASWVARTAAGVMISHEIRPNQVRSEYWEAMTPLLDFGYGTDEVTVHNYWDEDYPVNISGGETSSLLLTKGNEALLFVCDYGEGGEFSADFGRETLGRVMEAVHLETGEPAVVNSGKLSWKMKKHDYAIFHLKLTKNE